MSRTTRIDLSKVSIKGKNFRDPNIIKKMRADNALIMDLRQDPELIEFSIKIRKVIKKYANDDFPISSLYEKIDNK